MAHDQRRTNAGAGRASENYHGVVWTRPEPKHVADNLAEGRHASAQRKSNTPLRNLLSSTGQSSPLISFSILASASTTRAAPEAVPASSFCRAVTCRGGS